MVELFENEEYTIKQLAEHFNVSETTIRRRLKECGIRIKKKKYGIEDFETDDNHISYYYKETFRLTDKDIERLKEGEELFAGVGDSYCISLVYVKNNK